MKENELYPPVKNPIRQSKYRNMVDFELKDEWSGWAGITIPDDITVSIQMSDTTHKMQISLMKLLHFYGCAMNEEECNLTVGTGGSLKLVKENDHVWLKKYPLKIRTTFEELQSGLEPLLRQVFIKKNERDGGSKREESIRYAQERVQEKDTEYDVKALYCRLMSE